METVTLDHLGSLVSILKEMKCKPGQAIEILRPFASLDPDRLQTLLETNYLTLLSRVKDFGAMCISTEAYFPCCMSIERDYSDMSDFDSALGWYHHNGGRWYMSPGNIDIRDYEAFLDVVEIIRGSVRTLSGVFKQRLAKITARDLDFKKDGVSREDVIQTAMKRGLDLPHEIMALSISLSNEPVVANFPSRVFCGYRLHVNTVCSQPGIYMSKNENGLDRFRLDEDWIFALPE
ncbi:MAG: hypothetical protein MRY49_00330 [Candidatus Pacebacteria bacterium]|nr:hypothetical protein [Candidatus Paceibacterota bacterium]